MKIKFSVDSTCDLGSELMSRYDITPLALTVTMGGKEYKDMESIVPDDIYSFVDAGGELPKTSAVNADEYRKVFEGFLKDYDAVIHICLSSEMSSCYTSACAAAEGLSAFVIDSRNLSTGSGHLALRGCELAQKGMSAEEIARDLNETAKKVDASFIPSRLDYLYKGGRCSAVAMLGANLLKLKPCIEVVDGAMGVGKKYRGTFERCLSLYVKDRLTSGPAINTHRIFITHSGVDKSVVEHVRGEIAKYIDFDEVLETRAGCTISSHCGNGTLGILFIREDEVKK